MTYIKQKFKSLKSSRAHHKAQKTKKTFQNKLNFGKQFNKLLMAFKAGVTNSQRLVRLFFQQHLVAAASATNNDSALPAVVLSL